jgi:hypothetical protein
MLLTIVSNKNHVPNRVSIFYHKIDTLFLFPMNTKVCTHLIPTQLRKRIPQKILILHIQSTFETLNENNALLHQNLSYPWFSKFGALAQSELFPNANQKWVDSVFKTLTVDQKIGQLMMPRANYNATYDTTRLNQIVRDYHVGGLVFFAGNPSKQAVLVNKLQAMAKVPMLIGMDLEWGLSMRLDSTTRFPIRWL